MIKTEFNIEGNPSLDFLRLVKKNLPDQVTLVPDSEKVITSDSGWDTVSNKFFLIDVINELKELGIRTSIFVDPEQKMIDGALESGADRIELYTKSFADLYPINPYCKQRNDIRLFIFN